MPDVREFLDELSSGSPVPGGGSVAALEAAMAASLVSMVASLTLGRKRYANVWEQADLMRGRAVQLRNRAYQLVSEDSEAYSAVAHVFSLPRTTEEEKAERRERLQEALQGAAEPPLETMDVAAEVVRLCVDLARIANPSAISDVGTAALSGRAAYHAARLNVEANLALIDDAEWVETVRGRMAGIANPDDEERGLMQQVLALIGGSTA